MCCSHISCLVAVSWLTVLGLGGGAQNRPTGAAEAVAGSWKLVSYTRTVAGQGTIHPFGEDAVGRLLYQNNGSMALVLMRRERSKLADGWGRRTPEESHAIAREFFAYSGAYTAHPGAGTVTHHVEACSNPDWLGTDRVRKFEWLGTDQMVQRTTEGPPSQLVWQRER